MLFTVCGNSVTRRINTYHADDCPSSLDGARQACKHVFPVRDRPLEIEMLYIALRLLALRWRICQIRGW